MIDFLAQYGDEHHAKFVSLHRHAELKADVVVIEVDIERTQKRAASIKAQEALALMFPDSDAAVTVLALRDGFPFTLHQNAVPAGFPSSLCVDDRPWQEAKLTWTPSEFVRQIRDWLSKASAGALQDPAQPLEPLFYASSTSIMLDRAILDRSNSGKPVQLIGTIKGHKGAELIVTRRPGTGSPIGPDEINLVILSFFLPSQIMTGIHQVPDNLRDLAALLKGMGLDFLPEVKRQLVEWAKWASNQTHLMDSQLGLCIIGEVVAPDGRNSILDGRTFFTGVRGAGDVGVKLGCLFPAAGSGINGAKGFVPNLFPGAVSDGQDITIFPVNTYLDFDRQLAAEISGLPVADERKVTMIGAGSIGSHIALCLAREGAFKWNVIDDDIFLPHNMARHALSRPYLGNNKASALAHQINRLLNDNEVAKGIATDCLTPSPEDADAVQLALFQADVILDTSASIAVSRHLSDLPDANGRRFSVFFNPAGTAVVLLAEAPDRSIPLREIEAQYYGAILTNPVLNDHLGVTKGTVRYSGSCRTLTNKIPERSASILSAAAVCGIHNELKANSGGIYIWHLADNGSIQLHHQSLLPPTRKKALDWTVSVDANTLAAMRTERVQHLPSETGGVLLGVVDFQAQRIHVVHHLSAPEDSFEDESSFRRGIQGLASNIDDTSRQVMHQVRYVGEWHSHPKDMSANASSIDVDQLAWLSLTLNPDGVPGVMLIVGEDDESVNVGHVIGGEES
jgi:integrative and conjugative element protein (TIGR02256 family)